MWDFYDRDRSGTLDKNESQNFMTDIVKQANLSESFSNLQFNSMFNICDLDGSGTIEKNEMYQFAIKLLKLEGKDQQD